MGNEGTTRRDMLKKAAVAGAVVWTVPTVTATPAFAAGSLSTNLCPGEITTVTYKWAYRTDDFDVCTLPGQEPDFNNAVGAGGADLSDWEYALVTAYNTPGNSGQQNPINVDGTTSPKLVAFGGSFVLSGKIPPNTSVVLQRANVDGTAFSPAETYTVTYHFSCSDPLCFGDKHGPLEVVSYTVK